MTAAEAFDCVVVGSGPGGYVAAIRAAQLGMRTAVVERAGVGGRCLHWACIPAKTVLRSADVVSEIQEAGTFGIQVGPPHVDFSVVAKRRQEVVRTLSSGVGGLLKKNQIEVVTAEATLTADRAVRAGNRLLAAPAVVLATGSVRTSVPGVALGGRVVGTEEAWSFEALPRSLVVVGAGASGTEIASAYARLGSDVRLVEYADRVLPTEDADVSAVVRRGLQDQGVTVHTSTLVAGVDPAGAGVACTLGEDRVEAEWLVVAAGRRADVAALGLDAAGVALDGTGRIAVDGHLRTSADGVYAIGDLVAGPALAHKASDEGIIAVETAAGNTVPGIDHAVIPRATFCTPNVGSVGITEAAARDAQFDVTVGKVPYRAVGAGTVYGDRSGLVKIVGDRRYGTVLGAHIVGPRATELVQEIVDVMVGEVGYPELARTVHGHPTLSEAILEAARAADGWLVHG
ncbi:MAG TPA: dihydrolipoyl dehydrogenase [Acidimicrobiales bacterium]|nr:dihydrolipoyl dehydrogenase [Acidimicrobiales bacterium]